MEIVILVIVGLLTWYFLKNYWRSRNAMYITNVNLAKRKFDELDPSKAMLPSWRDNDKKIEEFIETVVLLTGSLGVPTEFYTSVSKEEANPNVSEFIIDRVDMVTIAALIEREGASFNEQISGVVDVIKTKWSGTPKNIRQQLKNY